MHQAANVQFERAVHEFARWRAVPEDARSPAPAWWWGSAFEVRGVPQPMPAAWCASLELPDSATYAVGAAIFSQCARRPDVAALARRISAQGRTFGCWLERDDFSSNRHPLYLLFEHDLRANASRLSRGKTGTHFSGSCSRRLHFSVLAAELSSRVRRLLQAEEAAISAEARSEAVLPTAGMALVC